MEALRDVVVHSTQETGETAMRVHYEKGLGVFIAFDKDKGEVPLAIRVLDSIARDLDDAVEADKIQHTIVAILESENSQLN